LLLDRLLKLYGRLNSFGIGPRLILVSVSCVFRCPCFDYVTSESICLPHPLDFGRASLRTMTSDLRTQRLANEPTVAESVMVDQTGGSQCAPNITCNSHSQRSGVPLT